MLQDGALTLALAECQRAADLRVLLVLMENVSANNQVRIKRRDLWQAAGVSEQQCCTSLRYLASKHLIKRTKEDPRHFLVSPELVWRGFLDHRPKAVREWFAQIDTPPDMANPSGQLGNRLLC